VQPKRILVVDDHPGIVATLRVAFRVDGDRFRLADSAGSVSEGLAHAAAGAPDAVVLDLQLPDGAGAEVVRRFHGALDGTPLIIHSAGADMGHLGPACEMAAAIVTKGDLEGLLSALARATGLP
jgi:two-component system KDP operon response regulator KdpE